MYGRQVIFHFNISIHLARLYKRSLSNFQVLLAVTVVKTVCVHEMEVGIWSKPNHSTDGSKHVGLHLFIDV